VSARVGPQQIETDGMNSWRGLHPGSVPCHREKNEHAQWRWGKKKAARRARRRAEPALIDRDQEGE